MIVGVDFDNTLVCYDDAFSTVARELRLIDVDGPRTKRGVRDQLRAQGREDAWVTLQGEVYGPHIQRATPFDGARAFVLECRRRGIGVRVVSHKTRAPASGRPHDLIAAARGWLATHGFVGDDALAESDLFFEATRAEKVARIAAEGCDWFIDDLPEVLSAADFPNGVRAILFDPHGDHAATTIERAATWDHILRTLLP